MAPTVDPVIPDQCPETFSGLRCELPTGHNSAHGARRQHSVLHWANHRVTNSRLANTDWVTSDEDDDEGDDDEAATG